MAIIRIFFSFSFYISILVSNSILFSRKLEFDFRCILKMHPSVEEKFTDCCKYQETSAQHVCCTSNADEWGMLYTFLQPAFLYRIIARLALHPCRVTHMPYRPVKKLRRAIDDPEQPTLSPLERISCFIKQILCNILSLISFVMLYILLNFSLFYFIPPPPPIKITNTMFVSMPMFHQDR